MLNTTTCSPLQNNFYTACSLDHGGRRCNSFMCAFDLSSFIFIAVLSPLAVAGNAMTLVAIWKKTFQRTPFHVLLSGLAFTDLLTGLIAQPFLAVNKFVYSSNPAIVIDKPAFAMTLRAIGEVSATYSISITILLITLMSVERWLYMSRRSLVTSRRECFTFIILLLLPVPLVVTRSLHIVNETKGSDLDITIIALMLFCYFVTAFAYFKVYRIIRHHQQQVQSHETSQNFGHQAIDLAKYKKSVASMLYIILLFSICFLPYTISSGVYIFVDYSLELHVINTISLLLLFLSSSLNPCLYFWRMNDIRNGVKQLACRSS